MNFLAIRFVLWFFTLAVFPVPVTLWARSFHVEVLERITLAALPQERGVQVTERVLLHLEQAEKKEIDPWLRDDIRIAWITTRWSQRGIPSWSLHSYATPYVAATWQVLHCHPEQVWPNILASREAKLGPLHDQFWGPGSSPRKPVRSISLSEAAARKKAA